MITIHPIAKTIIYKRGVRIPQIDLTAKVFKLPTADGANKILKSWIAAALIDKRITWSVARLSFSILLQDERVDAPTVALLLGHSLTKYVNNTYKRHRPKDQAAIITKLPSPQRQLMIIPKRRLVSR